MALLQIIYTSRATQPLDRQALRKLVADASKRNLDLGITGILYCTEKVYLQVLEGEEKAVLILYADILRDERHEDIHTVAIRPVDSRDFSNWSMGLLDKVSEPIDLGNVLSRDRDRIGIWNDAKWQTILNTVRAELEMIEP